MQFSQMSVMISRCVLNVDERNSFVILSRTHQCSHLINDASFYQDSQFLSVICFCYSQDKNNFQPSSFIILNMLTYQRNLANHQLNIFATFKSQCQFYLKSEFFCFKLSPPLKIICLRVNIDFIINFYPTMWINLRNCSSYLNSCLSISYDYSEKQNECSQIAGSCNRFDNG